MAKVVSELIHDCNFLGRIKGRPSELKPLVCPWHKEEVTKSCIEAGIEVTRCLCQVDNNIDFSMSHGEVSE